jgi:uncharacterized protein with HEPN domain
MLFMRSDGEQNALRDILHHINLAEIFARGEDFASFRDDLMRVYAVTRCLEIISEASRRLSDALKVRHPDIPWRAERGTFTVTITRTWRRAACGIRCSSLCRHCEQSLSKS